MDQSTSKERIITIELDYSPEREDKSDSECPKEEAENDKNNSKTEEEIKVNFERNLPWVNCKEKIIIAIDSAEDENATKFKVDNTNKTSLAMIKHCLQFFVRTKHLINKNHEFAIVILNENNVEWKLNFTNNCNKIINCIENIISCEPEDIFELKPLLETILDHTDIPKKVEADGLLVPPPYIIRCILIYGRSYTIPNLESNLHIEELLSVPYFILDVLMTHEPEGSDNNITKIFKELQNLDKKSCSYFFSVERSCKKLHNALMVLLGHPLQRPVQRLADYSIKDWEDD